MNPDCVIAIRVGTLIGAIFGIAVGINLSQWIRSWRA